MLNLTSKTITLSIAEDALKVEFTNAARGQRWTLDPKSLRCTLPGENESSILIPESARQVSDHQIEVTYRAKGSPAVFIYALCDTYIEVTFSHEYSGNFAEIVLPGSFEPEGGGKRYLIPLLQGMYWDLRGEPFDDKYGEGWGGGGFSMAMFGCLGNGGALLCTAETSADCLWSVGKDQDARTWVVNLQIPSLGSMRYDRMARFYFTKPTITAAAKQYRARVIEKGRFKPWKEKIQERPALERLFGTALCFIGYSRGNTDYAGECHKLKAMGFDRALVYPALFNTYSADFLMDGRPPVSLSQEQVRDIKELGYDIGPWTWLTDDINDGSEETRRRFAVRENGGIESGWSMGGVQWDRCCASTMLEYQKEAIKTTIADMTWDHFDVVASYGLHECYASDHPNHPGRPMDKRKCREFFRELFLESQAGARAVGGEDFTDSYSLEYDIGFAMALPQYGPYLFWPIPLTMLVYHDSMLQTWWEHDNYNNFIGRQRLSPSCRYNFFFRNGSSGARPELMATADALYGGVPNLFPFGTHSAWTGEGGEMLTFEMSLENPDTRTLTAIELAKKVAALHRETGMLEMLDFEFLSDNGYIQKTVFEGGIEIYANFSHAVFYLEGVGSLKAESWTVVRR